MRRLKKREKCRLHRPGRQPPRKHRQLPQNQQSLPLWTGGRPRRLEGEVAGTLEDCRQHKINGSATPKNSSFFVQIRVPLL